MSDRGLEAAYLAAITSPALRPVMFIEAEFTGGTLRLWSGVGEKSWNGQTWIGAGQLLGISDISETTEMRAAGVTVSLSGMDDAVVAAALSQSRQGLPSRIWEGALADDGAVLADPVMAFEGRLDVPEIEDGAETSKVSITYESRLIDLERPRERRITHEDQQIEYPGDLGRAYVAVMQDQVLTW